VSGATEWPVARDNNNDNIWRLNANNGNYNNHVLIHYGKQIHVDVTMEEKLKYIEEKIVMKLFESFGLDQNDQDTELAIYYYTKKASYFFESEEEEIVMN
jgi:hypothetical protein